MLMRELIGLVILIICSILSAGLFYWLVGKPLRLMLDELVKMPACTDFYCRVLWVGLIFISVGTVFDNYKVVLTDEYKPLMDNVWRVVDAWGAQLSMIMVVALVYVFMITILVAALRRKVD